MTVYYYIVKRANSKYTTVQNGLSSWAQANELAEKMQRENNDGEYFSRHMLEKSWTPVSSFQSGFDYL